MSKPENVIAIDGPSGSGKSTIAKIIAEKLDITYIDTGSMFRAIGYKLKDLDIDYSKPELSSDEEDLIKKKLSEFDFEYGVSSEILIRIDGEDLTNTIREHYVSDIASKTSKYPVIRKYLCDWQRKIALKRMTILDGRDIGTVIFPNALLKVYLTASSDIRARRRYDQLVSNDPSNANNLDINQIEADIIQRDKQDMERETAPLKQAEDALALDSTSLNIEEVVSAVETAYQEKINNK